MGYVNHILNPNERIVYEAKLHWKIFVLPIAVLLLASYLYLNDWLIVSYLSYPIAIIGVVLLIRALLRYFTNEFAITNERVILKQLIFAKQAKNIPLNQLDSANHYTPILGRIFDYGTISCLSGANEQTVAGVSSPELFCNKAIEQARNPQVKSSEDSSVIAIEPLKATPASESELERIRKEFKFYSPAQKSYKTAPLLKVGEEWELDQRLPSGLLLWMKDNSKWWQQSRWWDWTEKDTTDYRLLQYDVESHQSKNPRLSSQIRNTHSISWHPTVKWLATTGDGCLAKLWDAETGKLITTKPYYMSTWGTTICWSYDGEIFAGGERAMFDGRTGEILNHLPGIGSRYSSFDYAELRGFRLCNPSSSNNFSPWRPNSNQFIVDDRILNYPSGNGKIMVFRNNHTSAIEKIIDCDVESDIIDLAWHPKGRFIAVAFERNKIRIIDIDETKILAVLSVQYIGGWSPDGKILVAREDKNKDEFVIWDALEPNEKLMPEEMKNALWFRRFSENISADGLRYIRGESIYSLESDELLFTLPERVESAAWCPIDGGLLATCGGSETHIWRI